MSHTTPTNISELKTNLAAEIKNDPPQKISGNILQTDLNDMIDVLSANSRITTGLYTCSTAAATATKAVTIPDYVMEAGGAFKVKFTYANSAANPVLKINTENSHAIVFNGAVASATNTWGAGEVVEFYYDPTYNSNAGGFIGRSTVVSVSQNTETGHTEIHIGSETTPVPSVDEVNKLGNGLDDISDKTYTTVSQTSIISDAAINGESGTILSNVNNFSVFVYKYNENKVLRLTVDANYGTAILTKTLPAIGVAGTLIMSGAEAGESLEIFVPSDSYLCITHKASNNYNVIVEDCKYVLSGADATPTSGSNNLVKSGGVYTFAPAFKGILTAQDNIDTLTQEGNFFVDKTVVAGTYPDNLDATYITLFNYGNGNFWTQIAVESKTSNNPIVWFRSKYAGTWKNWKDTSNGYKRVLTSADNIDTLKVSGIYIVDSDSIQGTLPKGVDKYSILNCYGDGNFFVQYLMTQSLNADTWCRTYVSASHYTEWVKVINTKDIGFESPNFVALPTEQVTSKTVTFAPQADGGIKVNGTATEGNAYVDLSLTLNKGVYTLWGAPQDADRATYHYYLAYDENSAYFDYAENGYSFLVPNDDTPVTLWIRVMSGVTADNVMFYPFIAYQNYQYEYPVKKGFVDYRPIISKIDNTNYGWSGKKMCLIGDSITDGANYYGFSSFGDIVARILNLDACMNYGVGGCTIAKRDAATDASLPPVVDRWNDMIVDADIIYVHAGTNDWSSQVPLGSSDSVDTYTFNGALNVIMAGLKAKYPTALIVFDTILNRIGYDDVNYGGTGTKPILTSQYSQCIIDRCKAHQLIYHDVYNNFGLDLKYDKEQSINAITNDGLHPNAKGTRILGRKIAGFINTH